MSAPFPGPPFNALHWKRGCSRRRTVLFLKGSLDQQYRCRDDEGAVLAEEVGANDRLYRPRLVLHGQKDKTLGGARSLAHDHGARHPNHIAVPAIVERSCRHDPASVHFLPYVRHQVGAGREVEPGVVGDGLVDRFHFVEW